MPEYARVCQSMPEYARVCQSVPEYARISPETTRFTIEMKVQSTFYIDFISKAVDVLLISSFITKQMPKLFILDAFTLLICKKNVAIYALLRCKIFSLKIWLCKFFDKFHV